MGHLYNSITDTHNNYNNTIDKLFLQYSNNKININNIIFTTTIKFNTIS